MFSSSRNKNRDDLTDLNQSLNDGNSYGHYLQNIGEEPLEFVEIFRGAQFGDKVKYDDFSLTQWLALLPASVAAKQLNVSENLVSQLKKEKQIVVSGSRSNANNSI